MLNDSTMLLPPLTLPALTNAKITDNYRQAEVAASQHSQDNMSALNCRQAAHRKVPAVIPARRERVGSQPNTG